MSIHIYSRELVAGRWNVNNVHYVDAANYPIPLAQQVKSDLPGKVFTLRCSDALATFDFVDVLTAGEITILDAAVVAHKAPTASYPPIVYTGKPTAQLTGIAEVELTNVWQTTGGVVTNPGFWVEDVNSSFGIVTLCAKSSGVGAKLKLVQDILGVETDLNTVPFELPDTGGAWLYYTFTTDVPPQGGAEGLYLIQGWLDGAISATIKMVSLALSELTVVSV